MFPVARHKNRPITLRSGASVVQRALAAVLIGAAFLSCTDADLRQLPLPPPPAFDNRLEVQGTVCTEAPEDLLFPMRVLFVVDGSESMEVTDPPDPVTGETGRERAVRETAAELFAAGGDVKVGLIRFSSETQPLTETYDENGDRVSYFTDDMEFLESRLPILAVTDRTTNYINALAEAYSEVRDELSNADQESLALSTYHVIMISDGIPDAEQGETVENSSDNILASVGAILDLGSIFHVDRMEVSTALLSPGNAQVDLQSEELLEDMSDVGEGTFRKFASGADLNFLYIDLTQLKRIFTLRSLVAQNMSAVVIGDESIADSDGDGLEDIIELEIGSDPLRPDTDGDGCRDMLEHRNTVSGLDPLDDGDCDCFVPDYCFDDDLDGQCDNGCLDVDLDALCDCIDEDLDGICDDVNYVDTDGDGLVDCEERWSGTNRRGADTDADGLADFHELRFGTSPDIDDFADDLDWDAVPNGEEVRTGTDPHHASKTGRFDMAYRYMLTELEGAADGRSCYDFSVGNVTLLELLKPEDVGLTEPIVTTGPGGQGYNGRNRVLLYFGEVPLDDFETYARYRVGCVEAAVQRDGNYRNPPSGVIELNDDKIVPLAEFDPAVHCVTPGG